MQKHEISVNVLHASLFNGLGFTWTCAVLNVIRNATRTDLRGKLSPIDLIRVHWANHWTTLHHYQLRRQRHWLTSGDNTCRWDADHLSSDCIPWFNTFVFDAVFDYHSLSCHKWLGSYKYFWWFAAQRYYVHQTCLRENRKDTKVVCLVMWTYDICAFNVDISARTMTIIDKNHDILQWCKQNRHFHPSNYFAINILCYTS